MEAQGGQSKLPLSFLFMKMEQIILQPHGILRFLLDLWK